MGFGMTLSSVDNCVRLFLNNLQGEEEEEVER